MKADRRKVLTRAYVESRRPMGIYRVRSIATGRSVVGSTVDLRAMLNRQRAQLRLGVHPDKALQAEWDRGGADAFSFEVLDTLEPRNEADYDPTADLRALHELWRERLGEAV